MDKYDTSHLTEFPRFEPESSQSGVTTFFNKIWKLPLFSPSETVENMQNKTLMDSKLDPSPSEDQDKREYDDIKPDTGSYAVENEGRSLPNVLRRISSLVALGSGGGTRYADTEWARYWMPDDISRECYECAMRFSALRRRHHCRVCGQIFCSLCCSQRVPGHIFGCAGGLRVCNYCSNVVLSYLKENDANGEMSTDLKTLQENLQVKFPENKALKANKQDNFMLSRDQEERCEVRNTPKEALQDVFRQLSFTLPTQQHRYRLVRYNGVWRGCDMLQWVMDNTNNKTRAQASLVCQNLLNSGYIECAIDLPQFADYALYKPIVVPPNTTEEDSSPEERTRMVESVSSYCLNLNLGDSSARLIKAPKNETKSTPSSDEENPALEHSDEHVESRNVCKAIIESGDDHLLLLLRQCLARAGLSASWLHVLYGLCQQAADITMPDLFGNDIDVRNYVQIKKVPGGAIKDSHVIPGVVMTKNVAHRGMPQDISNPSVLLLDCSVAYQRVEGKLTSLEPVLMQEQEYLVRCAARITTLRPNVVLVRGAVARAVQDALRVAGVALAAGLGAGALRRLTTTTGAEVLTSIDVRIGTPKLGYCKRFYIRNYSEKTLMVLEGCAEPQLGCCIILRGATLQELIRVKKVVKFMLLACYNWKLEKSFLGDIEAVLPEPGMSFDNIDESDVFKDFSKDNDDTRGYNDEEIDKVFDNDNRKLSIIVSKEDLPKSDNVDDDKRNAEVTEENDEVKDHESKVSVQSSIKQPDSAKDMSNEASNSNANKTENEKDTKEVDDPLQRSKFVRKTESDKTLSCGVPIRDFSDPLRSTLSVEDDVFLPKEEATLKADEHSDRWSTDDAVLSMCPNVIIPSPYLETEAGRRCSFRRYFPKPLLRAPPPRAPHTPRTHRQAAARANDTQLVVKEVHPFIANPITTLADDPTFKAALAHYRATGCRTVNSDHNPGCPLYKPSVISKVTKEAEPESNPEPSNEPLDPFAPENHQRLSVLLYSFSNKSANVPHFCVNPWNTTMEMYGQRDISLGAFLEKYCFNGEYKCPSNNCQVPTNQHVRRFVHGDVCITVTCNTVGHSNVDKLKEEQSKQMMFWSRCESCGAVGRARRLSRTSLSVSLAQYVWSRCVGSRYARARTCPHPLHTHAHAFVSKLTTACFRYSKIQTFDIQLPQEVINTRYDTKLMRDSLINQLNELMLKGHEIFSGVSDVEAEKDYQSFKQQTEQIHVALTSSKLQEHTTVAAVVRSLWSVSDHIISAEKMLSDAQDKWSSPPVKSKSQPENNVEEKSDIEDSGDASNETADNTSKELEKEHGGTEEDEEKGDKKTVRQILSQLLSNNSNNSNQGGIIISSGLIPIVVLAGEIGSVIAATLASVTYQRARRAQKVVSEDERDKDSKRNADHVEVLLKDGLLCRVYYAQQFQKLRHMVLASLEQNPNIVDEFASKTADVTPEKCCCEDREKIDGKNLCDIEEGFIRSLAHCVPWAAKGGKSGSTFCKTKDDRYVLKEMTKPEWQQFLEFAPHYFNYVTKCLQHKQPSLLARIVGVYSVGGAGNGVLVMENVWYTCSPHAARYDLKGSTRHRLVPDTRHQAANAANVLMDENLLNLRWETPLYIQSHTGSVLWSCIERDTEFLASNCVMDYSLLLGIENHTLVLGIIDYIRTFTWDKKLEHLVKKNLGSGSPTVVSPAEYKERFSNATRKYFFHCVAHWDSFYTHILMPPQVFLDSSSGTVVKK